ncbi:amino acid ABC transporter permease [Rhizobium albus]|nr:amino acid ABC transporter permease [Rhizobium albus]
MSVIQRVLPPEPPPPALAAGWSASRIIGHLFLAIWIAGSVALFLFLVGSYDSQKMIQYGPGYLSGLWITLQLVIISVVLGAILSVPVALGRMSTNKVFGALAYVYVYFFRGTPLIAQLFLIYYGLGQFRGALETVGLWTFFREPWYCALFAFTLNTAAYQAEILRGAIASVPVGQHEGAAALGLPRNVTFRKIILPQAMMVALRPYGNEIILMIKGSAIVSIITVFDLMGETRRAFSRTFDFQTYLWAAVFYLLIVEALRNLWAVLERRLTRHLKR